MKVVTELTARSSIIGVYCWKAVTAIILLFPWGNIKGVFTSYMAVACYCLANIQMKTLYSLGTSGTTRPMTQECSWEDWTLSCAAVKILNLTESWFSRLSVLCKTSIAFFLPLWKIHSFLFFHSFIRLILCVCHMPSLVMWSFSVCRDS